MISIKINFHSLCPQNLINCVCTESAQCSLWPQWFWSGSSQPKIFTSNPGPRCMLCGQEHSTENWVSCLANPGLGYKHPFCSEHQLLGVSELEPRKRNTGYLQWSEVIYWHYFEFLLSLLFIYIFCSNIPNRKSGFMHRRIFPFWLYEPCWRRSTIPFYES